MQQDDERVVGIAVVALVLWEVDGARRQSTTNRSSQIDVYRIF